MKKPLTLTALLFMFIISFSVIFKVSASETDEDKRILFISSYSYAWDTVQLQIDGIKEGIGDNIALDYEFMDTKRFPEDEHTDIFYEELKYHFANQEPYDAVILGDDAALNFAIQYRDEFFDGIPLIFEGINNTAYAIELSEDPLITGVLESLDFETNINFALTLYPNATQVVSILDDSVTGQAERKSFYENAQNFPDLTFTDINTSQLTRSEIIDALSSIDENSILIYILFTEDADGNKYTHSQSISLVSKYSPVAALRMVSGGIGEGLLGGNIVSMELSGSIAAEIATSIVNGEDPASFDVIIDSPNVYCIDEDIMRKYNLDLSLIPKDAVIVNHQLSFFQRNYEAIIPGIIILIIFLIVIVVIIRKNIIQGKLTKSLRHDRQALEKSSYYDFLTGIRNRTKLYADLSELILRNSICSLFIFDIDGFKTINDTYGHAAGDEVLKEVGRRLSSIEDKDFIPYRLAGDEFICILKNNFENDILAHANKCMELFKSDFTIADNVFPIKISLGISVYPDDTSDMTNLMEYADQAMYSVKKNGKNAYALYCQTAHTR